MVLYRRWSAAIATVLTVALACVAWADKAPNGKPAADDPLEPLMFLVGSWRVEGTSPFGPYVGKNATERRGRWICSRGDVFDASGTTRIFQNTWVYGYDEHGKLVCHVFDTAGVFRFDGVALDGEVQFVWKKDDAWRRFTIKRQPDGALLSEYVAHVPSEAPDFPIARFTGRQVRENGSGGAAKAP